MFSQIAMLVSRIIREPAVHTTAAVASVPATAEVLHVVGVNTDIDVIGLSIGLSTGEFWAVIGIAALFGALGGVVAELLSLHGNVELPHRHRRRAIASSSRRLRLADPRNEYDLGIVSRMALGAAAGVALLALYAPSSPTSLVANALIAGSAATGLFRLVQRRLLANAQSRPEAQAAPKPTAAKAKLSVVPSEVAAN